MKGRTVVVTGATSGIGLEAAKGLAARGATVHLVGRTEAKARAAARALQAHSGRGDVHTAHGDLGVQTDARRVARELAATCDRLDVLVNNAGVYMPRLKETPDGIETTFAVNHLGYHLVTLGLLDLLRDTAERHGEARIVSTASAAHQSAALDLHDPEMRHGYRGWTQYANTKLMNILWTRRLAAELADSGVTANCLHPGFVRTSLARRATALGPAFMLLGTSVEKGADTIVWLAASNEVRGQTGGYYAKRRPGHTTRMATDGAAADKLWEVTRQYVA